MKEGWELLDKLYDQLIKAAIQQNHKIEEQLTVQQNNFDKLYYRTEIPIDERILTVRWIKIPTFLRENKPTYYAIFLVDIPFWRKGELKTLYRQIIESIDAHDIDSHTIFLVGKLRGFFDKMDNRPRYYHIFRINTDEFTNQERKLITNNICNYLNARIQRMTLSGKILPVINKDIERLQYFIDTFHLMPVITCTRPRYESNTSHSKNEVLAMTTTKTSISNITRERGES